jgi:phage tail sheath protein FI
LQIKSIVDAYLDNVRSGGGIYNFQTIMDESNNTPDIIDQNFAIIDVGIEPVRGAQKFINRITVLKTGGISSGGFTVA